MDIREFIQNFAAQFDETDSNDFKPNTLFREIEEWSSLTSLSVIAMVDEMYSVKLTGEEIRNSKSIEDIYQIVSSKLN